MGLFKDLYLKLAVAGEMCKKLPGQDTSLANKIGSVRQTYMISFNKTKHLKHAVHFKFLKLFFFKLGLKSERWQLFLCQVIYHQPGLTALFFLSGEVRQVKWQ